MTLCSVLFVHLLCRNERWGILSALIAFGREEATLWHNTKLNPGDGYILQNVVNFFWIRIWIFVLLRFHKYFLEFWFLTNTKRFGKKFIKLLNIYKKNLAKLWIILQWQHKNLVSLFLLHFTLRYPSPYTILCRHDA